MDPSYIFFVEIEFNNAKKITLNLRKNDEIGEVRFSPEKKP